MSGMTRDFVASYLEWVRLHAIRHGVSPRAALIQAVSTEPYFARRGFTRVALALIDAVVPE